jgi:hypothetical protein
VEIIEKTCSISKLRFISVLVTLLVFVFCFSPNFTYANSVNDEDILLTEEQLQLLKDDGIIAQEVTLEDLNVQTVTDDYINEVKPTDLIK